MDAEEFRRRGREVIEYIIDYHTNIRKRRIMHSRTEGYLRRMLPESAPVKPESFDQIMQDLENCIMPGIIHWRHPRYFAYFPCGASYPSILADMLISTINCAGFSWAAGPACTELEILTLDWLGRMLGLPEEFLSSPGEKGGGGVFQVSATDAMLVTMIAARFAKTKELNARNPSLDRRAHLPFFMAYCSKATHSSIIKVVEVAMIQVHILDTDDKRRFRGDTLEKAIKEDKAKGLIPFFVFASLGTTAYCSCDVIHEIGPVCKSFGVWLHVDGAYAGSALICPEFRHFLQGIEFADSFSIDPSMWMLMNFDCCALWVQDRCKLTEALIIDPLYLKHAFSDSAIDYRHWGIPLSRRFRALKLWFVLRNYGVKGLQDYIRGHVRLAKIFENFVINDDRFTLENEVNFGLVCFRLKGENATNVRLLANINASGKIFLVGTMLENRYILRFCICSENTTDEDVIFAWETICELAEKALQHQKMEHIMSAIR